jgi:hypothetical protein
MPLPPSINTVYRILPSQSCAACETDEDELYGDCSLTCPSGALSASGYPSSTSNFLVLAFSAGERMDEGGMGPR